MNALDFPSAFTINPPSSIASNYVAWKSTTGQPGCFQEFPASTSKWGLAATTGAFHAGHVDCEGLGTDIECVAGLKWWVVARPKKLKNAKEFASIDELFEYTSSDGDSGAEYVLEAVLLKPGTRL